jgi:Rps23 Pro-64 3,4-dihydroxylase Tpa1-like proline 4-hydroxylase
MHLLADAFDTAGYVSRFTNKGRIRLEGALSADDAETAHFALEQGTPWELQLVSAEGQPEVINRAELNRLPENEIQSRLQAAAERAQSGLSWLRLGKNLMGDDDIPLKGLADLLKSPAFASFCSDLTGLSDLALSDLSAVCYRPGDFFTQHTDLAARLCFEWNFSKDWRPDWGGQVLFHSPSGDIEGGILPRFNDLSLFAGDQPRSIASVAPYAGSPRFSIVGRFL